jgi:hypothetical protein
MYDSLQAHQETKTFESYLLIQNCIQNECRNGIKEILLQKLTNVFQTGGKENDLMEVLR